MKTPIVIALVLLIAAAAFVVYDITRTPAPVDNGEPVATSTPSISYVNASVDNITVTAPTPGAVVESTFTVSGQARGPWYFEASFPLEVLDANGNQLLITPVQADGEWMTEDFVPFSIEITVPDYAGEATIVMHKDNPSGLPEHDASISFPVTIAAPATSTDEAMMEVDVEVE